MTPFNLEDYEPVEERLARFWKDHPDGRVSTRILNESEGSNSGSVIMVAVIYKKADDKWPTAIGHAQETPGSNPVNKTSWIENCETSAIGRALANMGYAPKGHRPSREEMAKAAPTRSQSSPSPRRRAAKPRAAHIALFEAAKTAGVDDELRHRISRMLTGNSSTSSMSDEDCDRVTGQLAWFQMNREAGLEALADWEAKNGLAPG